MARLVRWRDIEEGSTVKLKGTAWTVERLSVKKKTVVVTVSKGSKKSEHTAELKAKDVVELLAAPLLDKGTRDAARKLGERLANGTAGKPPKKATKAPPEPRGWKEAPLGDKAEANLRGILGAKLVGVQLAPDEEWVVPPVDVSTIASHLFLFHGIELVDVRRVGGAEKAKEIHDHEHANPSMLKVPHRHSNERPSVHRASRV